MSNVPTACRRQGAFSWDHLQHYGAAPTTADIVVDATAARTGAGGLHVTARSGVSTLVTLPTPTTSATAFFLRFYFFPVALPSASRVIWVNGASVVALAVNLRYTAFGVIELWVGSTPLGTSSSTFAAGRWHYVELGFSTLATGASKVKVNGNTEIDWVVSGNNAIPTSMSFGAIDTVAAALEYYVDDCVYDAIDFPGPGRVKLRKMFDVVVDSANWALTGSSKPAAVDPGTTFDDTTFIACSTNAALITFGLDALPADVKTIFGMSLWVRAQRTGGTNSVASATVGWRGDGSPETMASNSAVTNLVNPGAAIALTHPPYLNGSSVFGDYWPIDFAGQFTFGVYAASANGQKITAMWVEVDYTDEAGIFNPNRVLVLADFEDMVASEFPASNFLITGTAAIVQSWSRFGNSALQLTHAGAGQSRIRAGIDNSLYRPTTYKHVNPSFWLFVTTRPSGGSVGIWNFVQNTTRRISLFMNASGGLTVDIDGSGSSATANDTVPLASQVHIGMRIRLGSVGVSNTTVDVYVNNRLVLSHTAVCTQTTFSNLTFYTLGAHLNVTGGAVIAYDGYIVDQTTRHSDHLKITTLHPTGAGSVATAGYTANGAANKWDCVDEAPDDGDTTYVLLPTGLGVNTSESYALADLPGSAVHSPNFLTIYAAIKRDAGTNGVVGIGIELVHGGLTATDVGATFASTAAYGPASRFLNGITPFGRLTPAILADLEVAISQTSNTVATRVSALAIVLAYTAINDYAHVNSSEVMAIG